MVYSCTSDLAQLHLFLITLLTLLHYFVITFNFNYNFINLCRSLNRDWTIFLPTWFYIIYI